VRGTLSFTRRLVMAPIEVIDYLAVHELVHLKVKNHSKTYWAVVLSITPDYQERINWLKKNGHLLRFEQIT
jgi:predicted metal-dependent hydrolase